MSSATEAAGREARTSNAQFPPPCADGVRQAVPRGDDGMDDNRAGRYLWLSLLRSPVLFATVAVTTVPLFDVGAPGRAGVTPVAGLLTIGAVLRLLARGGGERGSGYTVLAGLSIAGLAGLIAFGARQASRRAD